MPKFVRVELANGAEASVTPAFAKRKNLEPIKDDEGYPVRADNGGKALPPTYPAKREEPAKSAGDSQSSTPPSTSDGDSGKGQGQKSAPAATNVTKEK